MKSAMKRFKPIRLLLILLLIFIAGRHSYINAHYPERLSAIETQRKEYTLAYKAAKQPTEKTKVIGEAKVFLENTLIHHIFPTWYGNPWSFSGDAAYPFKGTIACGAFVENTLRNMGFRIDHRLSMQPSEYIIKNLTPNTKIERFSGVRLDTFMARFREMEEGIYIVGLDNHVGFLYNRAGTIRFVHSQGYLCVISEIPTLSLSLQNSKYRVVGKLFDAAMIEKWLLQQHFPLRHDYFKVTSNLR